MRFAKRAGGGVLLAAQLARAQCSGKVQARNALGERAVAGVPQFVLDYAPISYIHHEDAYYPSDFQAQIDNTQPEVDFKVVDAASPLNLNNLDSLNSFGDEIYLTSKDDITQVPPWLRGVKPDCNGKTENATTAAVIVNDKGNGTVDAFYMYFYAYNWGGLVLDSIQVGNHVGDWEHNMVRFEDGVPKWVWYSQHANGQNFAYDILHKSGDRPLNYVGNGTHANYAIPGGHDHTIPNFNLPAGLLEDHTEGPDDGGLLWDPLLSAYFYNYTNATGTPTFTPLGDNADATPTSWLNYLGKWGDEEYPEDDERQELLFDGAIAKYASGPTGPVAKQLDREKVCPSNGNLCIYRWILAP